MTDEFEVGYAIGSGLIDCFCTVCGILVKRVPFDDAPPEQIEQVKMLMAIGEQMRP